MGKQQQQKSLILFPPQSYFPLQLVMAREGEEASKQPANHLLQEAVLAQDKLEQQREEKPAFALNPE